MGFCAEGIFHGRGTPKDKREVCDRPSASHDMVKHCHKIKSSGRKDHGEMWCDERVARVVVCTECLNPDVVCLGEGWIGEAKNCYRRLPFRLVIGMKTVYTNAEERAKVRPTACALAADPAEIRPIDREGICQNR